MKNALVTCMVAGALLLGGCSSTKKKASGDRIEKLEWVVVNTHEKLTELQSEVKRLAGVSNSKDVKRLKARLESLEKLSKQQYQELKKVVTNERRYYRHQLDKFENMMTSVKTDLESIAKKYQKLNKQLNLITTSTADLEKEVAEIRSQPRVKQKDINQFNKSVGDLKGSFSQLLKEFKGLNSKLENTSERLKSFDKIADEAAQKTSSLKKSPDAETPQIPQQEEEPEKSDVRKDRGRGGR